MKTATRTAMTARTAINAKYTEESTAVIRIVVVVKYVGYVTVVLKGIVVTETEVAAT
jgi:hypothetical protein